MCFSQLSVVAMVGRRSDKSREKIYSSREIEMPNGASKEDSNGASKEDSLEQAMEQAMEQVMEQVME